MRGQAGFFDVDECLKELSAKGDHLERLNALVDFELFRPDLARAVPRSDGTKGGRPPFDHVFMFKVLILQAVARNPASEASRGGEPPGAMGGAATRVNCMEALTLRMRWEGSEPASTVMSGVPSLDEGSRP